ncbi:hypothetical protein RN001_014978 [Aquatica leii]|uniref:Uncharacterized protein n=1 Tax=Aquatica leii TaxID=1421715 RepID=A0AAN7NYN1_9COLE|nr:hypothetical protein RN001_014978 [Aquatica leii]
MGIKITCNTFWDRLENMCSFFYPIVTIGLAAFVTYSGYCVYKQTQEKYQYECTYNLFESRLAEILHQEATKSESYHELCHAKIGTAIARRDFFMKKVQAANMCIKLKDYDLSIEYLIQAMAACSKPATLLQYIWFDVLTDCQTRFDNLLLLLLRDACSLLHLNLDMSSRMKKVHLVVV